MGSEEAPDEVGGVEVLVGPGVVAAVNLVENHVHARWGAGVGVAGYDAGWVGFGCYGVGGQFGASVVVGYRGYGEGHGDVGAPSAGVLMVALPH